MSPKLPEPKQPQHILLRDQDGKKAGTVEDCFCKEPHELTVGMGTMAEILGLPRGRGD